MAVPTVYGRLSAAWRRPTRAARRMSAPCQGLRLMVRASGRCRDTLERWRPVIGTVLSATGDRDREALSNPRKRRAAPGSVACAARGYRAAGGQDGGELTRAR